VKNKVFAFRLSAFICAFATTIAAGISCALFKNEAIGFETVFFRVIVLGLLYVCAISLSSLRWSSWYRFNYAGADLATDELRAALEKLGKIPLEFFVVYIAFSLIYLFALAMNASWIGLPEAYKFPVMLLCFAWSMLGAAGVYNYSDKLGSVYLFEQNLHSYPKQLREKRQQSKTIIIPSFTNILGLLYALSLVAVIMEKYKSLENIPVQTYIAAISFLGVYLLLTLFLLRIWNSNIGFVFASVINQMDQLLSSEKNLTERISIGSIDEISTLAGSINSFTKGLDENLGEIKTSHKNLSSIGLRMQFSSENTAAAIQQIDSGMAKVKETSFEQTRSVKESAQAVQAIADNTQALDTLVGEQNESISEASASVEQMVGNIAAISNSMNHMVDQFGKLSNSAQSGNQSQKSSHERIMQIAEQSKSLQETNKLIAAIASQTNLLAMNAAIEAAHAGDAGRGFAVVADEIRSLAQNAALNSRNIGFELKNIQNGISDIVGKSQNSMEVFKQVYEEIGTTNTLVQEIRSTLGEQESGAQQILEALKQMNDISSRVKISSGGMKASSSTLLQAVSSLRQNSENSAENLESMSLGIQEINKEVQELAKTAEETQNTITALGRSIEGFKTSETPL